MTQREPETGGKVASGVNKFLTFDLNDETYGIDILKIKEIIGIMDITAVPQAPDYVRGVINLRGKIIPVADLRLRLGFPAADATERTCIIVVDLQGEEARLQVGLVVDAVSEVVQIGASDIELPPSLGDGAASEHIQGMAKIKEKVVILLDIDRVLVGGLKTAFEVA